MMVVFSDRSVSSRAKKRVALLFLIVFPAVTLLCDVGTSNLSVIQVFQPEGAVDESIESVIHSAMALVLAQSAPLDPYPLPSSSERLSRDELIEYAKLRRADLILSGLYRVRDRDVTITIELVDVANGDVIAVAEVSRPLDLVFDRFATDAMIALQQQAHGRVAELITERSRRDADVPTVSEHERTTDEVVAPTITEKIVPARPRIQLAAEVGRPVPIGPFGEYFDPGYSLELLVQINLARVSAGLSTAFIRFDSDRDDMGEYVRSFVSIATDFSVRLFTIGPVEMFLRASAGAALRLHDGSPVSDRLGAALPLLRLGTGAQVWLSRSVSLVPGVSFDSMVHMFRESGGGPIGFEYIPVVRPTIAIAFRAGGR